VKLPFLVSVPHSGQHIPQEVQDICILTPEHIYEDSDWGAEDIYYGLEKSVEAFISSDVARAIVDLNRAADDFRKDGVVKTHTCYDIPVYIKFPSRKLIEQLLSDYYHPYHLKLEQLAEIGNVKVGIDCHTMAEVGPPVGPDAGKTRPLACISNADGTCPDDWLHSLVDCFHNVFPQEKITINTPFKGGFIVRNHSAKLPWLQIEFSRSGSISSKDKRDGVREALSTWSKTVFGT